MSVNPWYVPGSLRNIEPADGAYPTLLYVVHRMAVYVDGIEVAEPHLRLTYNGATVAAGNLPQTNWVCLRGELIEVEVDLPGGLASGRHQVRLEAVFGGGYGGGMATTPVVLCDFTAEST